MPVVMSMRWAGVTPEQYDAVRKAVNWEGEAPAGGTLPRLVVRRERASRDGSVGVGRGLRAVHERAADAGCPAGRDRGGASGRVQRGTRILRARLRRVGDRARAAKGGGVSPKEESGDD